MRRGKLLSSKAFECHCLNTESQNKGNLRPFVFEFKRLSPSLPLQPPPPFIPPPRGSLSLIVSLSLSSMDRELSLREMLRQRGMLRINKGKGHPLIGSWWPQDPPSLLSLARQHSTCQLLNRQLQGPPHPSHPFPSSKEQKT